MSAVNAKKSGSTAPANTWAGAMARMRRRGVSSRGSRRSMMLGVLSSLQTSSNRNGNSTSPRITTEI